MEDLRLPCVLTDSLASRPKHARVGHALLHSMHGDQLLNQQVVSEQTALLKAVQSLLEVIRRKVCVERHK